MEQRWRPHFASRSDDCGCDQSRQLRSIWPSEQPAHHAGEESGRVVQPEATLSPVLERGLLRSHTLDSDETLAGDSCLTGRTRQSRQRLFPATRTPLSSLCSSLDWSTGCSLLLAHGGSLRSFSTCDSDSSLVGDLVSRSSRSLQICAGSLQALFTDFRLISRYGRVTLSVC